MGKQDTAVLANANPGKHPHERQVHPRHHPRRSGRRYVQTAVALKAAKRRAKIDAILRDAQDLPRANDPSIEIGHFDQNELTAAFHHVDAHMRRDRWRIAAAVSVVAMSDTELEDELERVNDAINGGEGFENYIIVLDDDA